MEHLKYHVEVFWSEEDGGYIANVPDLKYCSAFGETYDEALREVRVAMDLHLDVIKRMGRTIPEPTVALEPPDTCDRLTRIGPRRRRPSVGSAGEWTDDPLATAGSFIDHESDDGGYQLLLDALGKSRSAICLPRIR